VEGAEERGVGKGGRKERFTEWCVGGIVQFVQLRRDATKEKETREHVRLRAPTRCSLG